MVYIYGNLQIAYYENNRKDNFLISDFSWTTPDIYSYMGVTVGENIRKLDDLSHETDNVENGKKYSIYFYSDGNFGTISDGDFSLAESKHSFTYNDKNKITEIVVAKAT